MFSGGGSERLFYIRDLWKEKRPPKRQIEMAIGLEKQAFDLYNVVFLQVDTNKGKEMDMFGQQKRSNSTFNRAQNQKKIEVK